MGLIILLFLFSSFWNFTVPFLWLPVYLQVSLGLLLTDEHGTACLNNFMISDDGVQENQVHTINVPIQEMPNLKFQPIILKYKFYSTAAWHPCTFSSEIETLIDLAENLDLRPLDLM